MKDVGIFGGSFNPIHYGHLRLAEYFVNSGRVDEVWLLVSPQNPLKERGMLLDASFRLELARAAVSGHAGIEASDFEFSLPLPSYTWRTLRALTEAYADCRFSLIIGADNWARFDRWARHDEILARYPLLIYPREGYPIDATTLPQGVSLAQAPLFPYSSTAVREQIRRGAPLTDMIPTCVVSLLRQHGYYTPRPASSAASPR